MEAGADSLKVKIFSSTKFFPEFELEFECTHTTGLPTNFKSDKKLGFHRQHSHAKDSSAGDSAKDSSQKDSSQKDSSAKDSSEKDSAGDPEFVTTCEECGPTEPSAEHDTWICLHCSTTLCGRDSANKHMEKHNANKNHSIILSLADGSFWCYQCERYLEHRFYPELHNFYRRFHEEKFGQRPDNDKTPFARSTSSLMKACVHCDTLSSKGFKNTAPFEAVGCSVCHSNDEENGNWVCLVCEKVFCSRFDSGGGRHGVEHWKQTGHSISMSLKDGSIWCYFCSEHQDHSINSNLSAYYAAFHVARHGEVPPLKTLKRMNSLLDGSTLTEDESSLLAGFDVAQFRWGSQDSRESSDE